MNEITYGVAEECYVLHGQERISYGLAAYADAALDYTATLVASVSDITSEYEQLAMLAGLCNRLDLSLIHLNDVVEDFLVEHLSF